MEKTESKIRYYIIAGAALLIVVIAIIMTKRFRPEYEFVSPNRGDITEAIYGLGKVKSRRKYEVKVAIMTTIERVYVREGETVKKNDPLIKFRDSAVFRAPFDGTITEVPFNEAETIIPQISAVTMEDLKDKYIEVSLEQDAALRVKKGQKTYAIFESLRGKKYNGIVTAIFPNDDEFLAHIEVDGLEDNVLPGMTVDVSIIVGQIKNALLVPVAGVNEGVLLIERNGKKEKLPVKIGVVDLDRAEVIEGDLKENDKVLIPRMKGEN